MAEKDYDALIIFIFGVIVFGLLGLGVIKAIKGSFQMVPEVNSVKADTSKKEQKRRLEDIQRQQKDLMRRREQKLRDFRMKTR